MANIIPFLQVSSVEGKEPLKYTQSKILKVRQAIDKSLEQKSLAGKQSAKVRASNRAKQGQQALDNRSYGNSTNINSNNTIIDKYSTVDARKEAERKRFNSNMLGNGV